MIVLCDPAGMVPVPDAAGVELVALAEALASPRTSFESAFRTARAARPDLAATIDASGFAQSAPPTGRPSGLATGRPYQNQVRVSTLSAPC
jgi:hypothetical protein